MSGPPPVREGVPLFLREGEAEERRRAVLRRTRLKKFIYRET